MCVGRCEVGERMRSCDWAREEDWDKCVYVAGGGCEGRYYTCHVPSHYGV